MMTRREFAALVPALAAARTGYAPKIAGQVYVWSQQFDKQKRSFDEGAEEMVSAFRRAGYKSIELVSWALSPRMGEVISAHKMEVPIVYVGGAYHTAELAEKSFAQALAHLETAKRFGAQFINTNPDPKRGRERKTDQELATQAEWVNKLAVEVQKRGMRLMLHHHDPEMAENAREWRHLLRNTDPKLTGLCLDVDWIIQGGQNDLAILKEAGSRIDSLHLRNASGKVWTESLGEGDYNYNAVASHLRSIGYRGYLVVELAHRAETRITRSLEENLRLSREYAEKTFGVKA